jgi:glucokinase
LIFAQLTNLFPLFTLSKPSFLPYTEPYKMTEVVIGMDIGGTNTAIGVVDRQGQCLSSTVVSTVKFDTVDALVDGVSEAIQSLLDQQPCALAGIGIGAPNGNYYRGEIEDAPNLKWRGVIPLAKMFRERFHIPSVLTNDANAAAIGEMIFGGAKGMKDFMIITLGTGVGSGIVVNGEVLYGHDGFAGEVGHTIYDPNGRMCGCGRRGCLETYASAGGLCRTVFELLAESTAPSVLREVSFRDLTAAQVAEAARNGDTIALQAFDKTGRILAIKLADAVAHTSPEAIFLFGGVAKAGDLIFKPTQKYLDEYILNIFRGKAKLLPSGLPEANVAILGAAALIWKELRK